MSKKISYFFSLAVALLAAFSCYAQVSIEGQLLQTTDKKPVGFATVSLFSFPDSSMLAGLLTDEKGGFAFKGLKAGSFKIRASYVGYESVWTELIVLKNNDAFRKLKVLIQPKTKLLNDVTVTGERSYMQQTVDKKVYNIARDLNSVGGNAADVLGNIPSVALDMDRNLTLRGNSSVTVLIDGKPSSLTGANRQAVLEQLQASDIEQVEVITNPSAKYDPDGIAGIINIILKKNRKAGFTGNAGFNVGNNHKSQENFALNYKQGKWNTWLTVSNASMVNYLNGHSDRTNSRDTLFYQKQYNDGSNRNNTFSTRLGAEYQWTKYLTVGASVNYSYRDYFSYNTFTSENRLADQRIYNVSNRYSDYGNYGTSIDYNVSARKTFEKPKKYVNIDLTYSEGDIQDYLRGRRWFIAEMPGQASIPTRFQITSTPHPTRIFTGMLDYSTPFSKDMKFETGLKLISRRLDNTFFSKSRNIDDSVWSADTALNNHFVYTENVYSAYGVLSGVFAGWNYTAGLRLEQTLAKAEQITTGQEFPLQYFSIFPSGGISRRFGNQEVNINYSRRINRPSIESLNPFPDFTDPYNFMYGNPRLRPEYISALEAGYSRPIPLGSFVLNVYYRYLYDVISRFRSVTSDGIANTSFVNIANSNQYGADLTVNIEPFKWWKNMINLKYFIQEMNGANLEGSLTNKSNGGLIRLTSNFKIFKTWDLQAIYSNMIWGVILQGRIIPVQALDLALRKDVLKGKGTINIRLSDVFDTRQFSIYSVGIGFEQTMVRKRESRFIMIGFSWRFGSGKDATPKQKKIDDGMSGGEGGF
jgi:outer membrane receptor protein involved in Fe transport